MSANNWTVCPKCKANYMARKASLWAKANEAYGKVPPERFSQLCADAEKPMKVEDSMREDYEIGVDRDGLFTVSYRASCQACDYEFSFKHEQQGTIVASTGKEEG